MPCHIAFFVSKLPLDFQRSLSSRHSRRFPKGNPLGPRAPQGLSYTHADFAYLVQGWPALIADQPRPRLDHHSISLRAKVVPCTGTSTVHLGREFTRPPHLGDDSGACKTGTANWPVDLGLF